MVDGRAYVGAWNGTPLRRGRRHRQGRSWTFQARGRHQGQRRAGRRPDRGRRTTRATCTPSTRPPGAERWRYTGGQRFYGGPAVSGDTLVIGDVGGAVIALDASHRAPALAPRHRRLRLLDAGDRQAARSSWARTAARFEALDLDDGAVRWSFDAGERISGSATVVGRRRLHRGARAPRRRRGATFGLDTAPATVRFTGDDGRYSPAVGAGVDPLPRGDPHHRCLSRPDAVGPPSGSARSPWSLLLGAGVLGVGFSAGLVRLRGAWRGRPRASSRPTRPRRAPTAGRVARVRLRRPPHPGESRPRPRAPLPTRSGRYDAGSLVEFPPVIADGRAVVGTNAGLAHRPRRPDRAGAVAGAPCAAGWPRRRPSPGRSPSSPPSAGDVHRPARRRPASRCGAGAWARRWSRRRSSSTDTAYIGTLGGPGDAARRAHRRRALERAGRRRGQGEPRPRRAQRGRRRLLGAGHRRSGARDGQVVWTRAEPGRARCAGRGASTAAPRSPTGGSSSATSTAACSASTRDTGEVAWVRVLDDYVYSSAAVADRLVFVGSYDHRLYALDAVTGRGALELRRRRAHLGLGVGGRATSSTSRRWPKDPCEGPHLRPGRAAPGERAADLPRRPLQPGGRRRRACW